MKYYVTNLNKKQFWQEEKQAWDGNDCMHAVNIYPDMTYQTMHGFGGAFTEAAGYNLTLLSEEAQQEVYEAYFSKEGLAYTMGRTHINSCDFALGNYAYVEDAADTELKSFDISHDHLYLIPMIKKAQEMSGGSIKLLASPWSPPAFMKTNGEMNHGGKLKREYYELWAKYLVKYIKAYKEAGIELYYLTIQNEPMATQSWDSCIYTSEEEALFIREYLGPMLVAEGLDATKILIWDHNKDILFDRVKETFADEETKKYVFGTAFHWYTGDHFEAVALVREKYPDMELIFTEGCVEYSRFAESDEVSKAEFYAHDILGNLNAGMNGYIDWNILLDELGGPNHVSNFCAAPIMCDTKKNIVEKRLSYYYIGQFSRFIKPEAKRIASTKYTSNLEVTAFQNPDGERVLVVLNRSEEDMPISICENNKFTENNISIAAHSIVTVLL